MTKWVDSIVGVGGAVAKRALKGHAPVVPTEMVDSAVKVANDMGGSAWLKRLALRFFRPHVYFVYKLSQDAGQLGNVLQAAAQLLPIGGRDASQPAAFLTRLMRSQWVI